MGRQSKGLLVTVVVLVALCGSVARSEPEGEYSIRGLIRAVVRPKQLPRVRLLTNASRPVREIFADNAGRFSFNELGPGSYWVEVSAPGFLTAKEQVSVLSRSTPEVVVQLQSEAVAQPAVPGAILDARVPPNAWQEWEQAELALQSDNAGNARKHLQKAVKEYQSFAAAYRLLALLDFDEDKLEDAEQHVRQARTIEPENAYGYALEGALRNRQGRPEEALNLLERAVALAPTWRGQFELAKAHFALKAFAEAAAAAQKALDFRNAAFPEAHVLMGNILVNLRRYPAAALEYQTFLKMAPDSPSAGPARDVLNKMKAAGIPVD
jgi:tetratricopeptide (TPR) repeat protein